jgi:methionine synthase / methylenetetrahydrofolate reductase(NADPH)
MDLLEALHQRVLPGDGAMGTLLFERGVPRDVCLEELCASRPELVEAIHREYVAAGARVIRTHSFGSNAIRLRTTGNERRVGELNWLAGRIARDAVKGSGALVAACVGPTGEPGRGDLRAIFEEQIGGLLESGADFVLLETFTDLKELLAAVEAKHSLHHCPVVASLACADGAQVQVAFGELRSAGADVVGVNCLNPADTRRVLEGIEMTEPFSAFPSAGLPQEVLAPAEFAAGAMSLVQRGIRLIGGCCGTTPAHIAALTEALV